MFDKIKEDVREVMSGSTPENDLRARLHADHTEITKRMDELLACEDYELAQREDLRDEIVVALTAHSRAEEEVVYVWLQQDPATRAGTRGAIRDHDEIDRVLFRLKGLDAGDPGLSEVIRELKATVGRHVHDEENELLPRAEKQFGREQLARLIPQFNARKTELLHDLELGVGSRGYATIWDNNPLGESDSRY